MLGLLLRPRIRVHGYIHWKLPPWPMSTACVCRKRGLQLTMLGFTLIFGALALVGMWRETLPLNSQLRQALGAAVAFW